MIPDAATISSSAVAEKLSGIARVVVPVRDSVTGDRTVDAASQDRHHAVASHSRAAPKAAERSRACGIRRGDHNQGHKLRPWEHIP